MFRKSNGRRRVNQQGAQKQPIGQKLRINIFAQLEAIFPEKYCKNVYKAFEKCFKLLGYYCCKFCLVPLSLDTNGKCVIKKSSGQMILHYSLLWLLCIRIAQQFITVVIQASSGSLDLTMIFSVLSFLAFTASLCLSCSFMFKKYETMQLLNTLPIIMQYFSKDGRKLGLLESPKSVLLTLAIMVITATIVVVLPLSTFLVESLPVSLYHIFNMTGILSLCPSMAPLVWKFIFLPAETLMIVQGMMLATWGPVFSLVLINSTDTSNGYMRNIPAGSLSGWTELRRRYVVYQVFIKLLNSWVRFMVVPSLTGICGCIIIFLYAAIRHTEQPLVLYLWFPSLGFTELFIVFWFAFEITGIVRGSEEIVGILNTCSRQNVARLGLKERLYQRKVLRATSAVAMDFGNFMDFTVDVPIGMWDEILNQLLFLLTL